MHAEISVSIMFLPPRVQTFAITSHFELPVRAPKNFNIKKFLNFPVFNIRSSLNLKHLIRSSSTPTWNSFSWSVAFNPCCEEVFSANPHIFARPYIYNTVINQGGPCKNHFKINRLSHLTDPFTLSSLTPMEWDFSRI